MDDQRCLPRPRVPHPINRPRHSAMMERCIVIPPPAAQRGEFRLPRLCATAARSWSKPPTSRPGWGRHAARRAGGRLRSAEAAGPPRSVGCTLYSNVEPCAMCAFPIRETRISRVVFAISSPMMGRLLQMERTARPRAVTGHAGSLRPGAGGDHRPVAGEAEQVWRSWNPLIWSVVKHRGYLGPEHARKASVHLDGIPERAGWLRRLFRLR